MQTLERLKRVFFRGKDNPFQAARLSNSGLTNKGYLKRTMQITGKRTHLLAGQRRSRAKLSSSVCRVYGIIELLRASRGGILVARRVDYAQIAWC